MVGVDHVRETIAAALRDRGYEVATEFGLSDFTLDLVVREAGAPRWQVAIVLDGPRWAQRPTVTDRDLTPLLLEDLMGWGSVMRIWLPEWLDAPDRVIARVGDALTGAKQRELSSNDGGKPRWRPRRPPWKRRSRRPTPQR